MSENVFIKLQNCRVELQNMNLRKSARNNFAGYDYFELKDFLPKINELFMKHKLFSHITFDKEKATLTIINSENTSEQIVFTSPMAEANTKGSPIQNEGSKQKSDRSHVVL